MTGRIVGLGAVVLAAILIAAPAAAAPGAKAGTWAALTATTAHVAAGFPDATVTTSGTTSIGTSETVVGATPPGTVYGTSAGRQYVSLATSAGTPVSSVTFTFATPTPATGWSVVVADVDAEDAVISGTTAAGAAVDDAALGGVQAYNITGAAAPSWLPGSMTLVGGGVDTTGASAWFSPTTPLSALTITANNPVFTPTMQVWIVALTASLAGRVIDPSGNPVPGATVVLQDTSGASLPGAQPLTADGTGAFEFVAVVPAPVQIVATAPGGSAGSPTAVSPVAGAFPVAVDVVAPARAVSLPSRPELPPTGADPAVPFSLALLAIVAGAALSARRSAAAPPR